MIEKLLHYLSGSPLICILAFLVTLTIYYLYNVYSYWDNRGVPGPKPFWIVGNIFPRILATISIAEFDRKMYSRNQGKKYCGYYEFLNPALMVGDPELLKHIMIKDFDHFTDRSFVTFNDPVMDCMLLGLKGTVWKRVRSVMTPTFSSGKIKQTLPLVKDCSENLVKYFKEKVDKGCSTFEMKEVYGMFTMDTIASIAFGVSSDSLNNPQDEFSRAAADFFKPIPRWKRPFMFLQIVLPKIFKAVGLSAFDSTPIKFFKKVVSDTIKFRLENKVRRSDFLQLLLDASVQEQANNQSDKNIDQPRVLHEVMITAQCILFYIAGYDTTATTLSFVSYCLALNPRVQQTLLEEIDKSLEENDGNVTFEAIQNMTYLDMVFAETLRLYPPGPRVDRCCTKDYILPGTDFVITKNMKITIPIYSIHHDPDHYANPEKFDPERFSSVNKSKRSPLVYMPFGSGPRNCIGMRFALMESKVALVRLLKDFVFIPSKKTQVPIKLEKSSGLLKAADGVWVRLASRVDE